MSRPRRHRRVPVCLPGYLSRRLSGRLSGRLSRRLSGDAGHEAVGQALLISIGLAGMVAASRLADTVVGGMSVVLEALR